MLALADPSPILAEAWSFVDRPFTVERRKWLFAGTMAGVQASARLYSLLQCVKANRFEPCALRRVYAELPRAQSPNGHMEQ